MLQIPHLVRASCTWRSTRRTRCTWRGRRPRATVVPPSVATSSRESAKTTPTSGTSVKSTAKRPTGILLVYRRESTITSGSELKILSAPLTTQLIWMKSYTQDLQQVRKNFGEKETTAFTLWISHANVALSPGVLALTTGISSFVQVHILPMIKYVLTFPFWIYMNPQHIELCELRFRSV